MCEYCRAFLLLSSKWCVLDIVLRAHTASYVQHHICLPVASKYVLSRVLTTSEGPETCPPVLRNLPQSVLYQLLCVVQVVQGMHTCRYISTCGYVTSCTDDVRNVCISCRSTNHLYIAICKYICTAYASYVYSNFEPVGLVPMYIPVHFYGCGTDEHFF